MGKSEIQSKIKFFSRFFYCFYSFICSENVVDNDHVNENFDDEQNCNYNFNKVGGNEKDEIIGNFRLDSRNGKVITKIAVEFHRIEPIGTSNQRILIFDLC